MTHAGGALAVLLALSAFLASDGRVRASQVFRAAVDAVQVDVLVTRGGKPVAGLTAADFELRDNGALQQVSAVALEDVPVTLTLVLDVSESVEGKPLEHLRSAIGAAAEALSKADRLGLFTFSHHIELTSEPTAALEQVRAAAASVKAGGATALYDATFASLVMRHRVPGRVVMLVFSDGDDTASWLDPRGVLTAAQRSDVVVYGVTLQRFTERENLDAVTRIQREQQSFLEEPWLYGRHFLSLLTAETGGSLLVAERTDSLRETFVRVVNEFKRRYILTYTPEGVESGGWHAIDVRLKGQRADIQARRGYLRGGGRPEGGPYE